MTWQIGLVVLCVVGVAVLLYGALADRAANRRRAAALNSPPRRTIPQFSPTAVPPHYVTEQQARRSPEGQHFREPPARPDAPTLGVGFASADFATDRDRTQAALDHPAVLVCADPVTSVRELLEVLEQAVQSQTALVVVAPAFAPEVLSTLAVNRIQGKVAVLAVTAARPAEWSLAAARSGATATEQSDRRAGYLPPEQLGHVDRWISTARASYLITAEDAQ